MSRIIKLTESDLTRIVIRVINEQLTGSTQTTTGETPNKETKVAGPIDGHLTDYYTTNPIQYYIYNKGGKFYVYQTNPKQKTPILMPGAMWSNSGRGYDTTDEANKVIKKTLKMEFDRALEIDAMRRRPTEMRRFTTTDGPTDRLGPGGSFERGY